MATFLSEHIGTILVSVAVLLAAVFAARSVYKARKHGGCSCSSSMGSCSGCSHHGGTCSGPNQEK